jgi:ABC-type transport system involved in cytochrome bd biosynthesis fused ATPase/permease subunit
MRILRNIAIALFLLVLTIALFGIRYWNEESRKEKLPLIQRIETYTEQTVSADAGIAELMEALSMQTTNETLSAPNFKLRSLSQGTINLAQYRGNVVLLAFWTTW